MNFGQMYVPPISVSQKIRDQQQVVEMTRSGNINNSSKQVGNQVIAIKTEAPRESVYFNQREGKNIPKLQQIKCKIGSLNMKNQFIRQSNNPYESNMNR
jgi:hypothetical protein